jgi:sortase (surface protein transpeptidase)
MMLIRRPAAITVAAGLLVIAAGTAGLLLTRHSTPAMRPPPLGVATVPAPAGPVATPITALSQAASPQSPQPAQSPQPTQSPPTARPLSFATPVPVAPPVSLTIPLIGVQTQLVRLGVAAGGVLQVPSSTAVAGWYTGSSRPGAIGPAIIVGHIDSVSGPGVFFRLSQLRAGDRVYVGRADGTTVEFRVTTVETYLKDEFPTAAVYGPVPDAELRLITCGGAFDDATGHYLSNVVVYATQTS